MRPIAPTLQLRARRLRTDSAARHCGQDVRRDSTEARFRAHVDEKPPDPSVDGSDRREAQAVTAGKTLHWHGGVAWSGILGTTTAAFQDIPEWRRCSASM